MVSFLRLIREQSFKKHDSGVATFSRMELISLFKSAFPDDGNLSQILDLLAYNKLLDAESKRNHMFEGFFITDFGVEFLRRPEGFIVENGRIARLNVIEVDSTDWTGLAKAVSPQNLQIIKEYSTALQVAIIQSDADIQTKTDACKRVEAVILLLEAPNVPWREVVNLLNHPSVTAFLAALNLIQFIIGLAR